MSLTNNDQEVIDILLERRAARKAGNFARADEIRKQLADLGITVQDARHGTFFYRGDRPWQIRACDP